MRVQILIALMLISISVCKSDMEGDADHFENVQYSQSNSTNEKSDSTKTPNCTCDRDFITTINDTTMIIPCNDSQCSMDLGIFDDAACSIEQSISVRPFETRRMCTRRSKEMDTYTKQHIILGWTWNLRLILFRVCRDSGCNADFVPDSLKNRVEREVERAVKECVPRSMGRLRKLVRIRRQLDDPLTCACTSGGSCKNKRCSNHKLNASEKKTSSCMEGGCTIMLAPFMKVVERYAAAYVHDKPENYKLFGCRHKDFCNAHLPKKANNEFWNIHEMVCHWMCPKLNVIKIQSKGWHLGLEFIFITLLGISDGRRNCQASE